MTKIMFYDLETTGLNPYVNGIHQLAGMIEIEGIIVETFNINMRPSEFHIIEPDALAVSNLTVEDIMNNPYSQEEGFQEFANILCRYVPPFVKAKDKDRLFKIGYNSASFDNNFLQQFFIQNNQDRSFFSYFYADSPDVMVLASYHFMSDRRSFDNFKLPTIAKRLDIYVDESRLHEALYDIELTVEIYYRLKDINNNNPYDDEFIRTIRNNENSYRDEWDIIY
jgi:DNA polymerase-3 subunit epsilon